jgi:exodeoxyribonuclease-3
MRIMTYNVKRGSVDGHRDSLPQIAEVIRNSSPDILAVQQATGLGDRGMRRLFELEQQTGLRAFYAAAEAGEDAALMVSERLTVFALEVDAKNFENPALILRTKTSSARPLTVVAAHLSSTAGTRRLLETEQLLKFGAEDNVILLGDLNGLSPLDSGLPEKLDQLPSHIMAKHVRPETGQPDTRAIGVLLAAGFVDLFRRFDATGEGLTMPTTSTRGDNPGVRVDYIFASSAMADRARSCIVRTDAGADAASDHYPVVAVFD